jgi:hypothetical protein
MIPILRILVSFHYARKVDLSILADHDGPVEVFADSGAFSAKSLGATIKVADYVAWLNDWSGLITTAASLDVIGDHVASRHNLRAIEGCGLEVLPVFHFGSPWPELQMMCARYPYVALGGMASSTKQLPQLTKWLVGCRKMGDAYGTVFHGFGQTSPQVLAKFPFYSVDSSSWASGVRYAQTLLWSDRKKAFLWIRHGTRRVGDHQSLIRAHGGNPALLANPGFAVQGGRPQAEFHAERAMSYKVSATSMRLFEGWLQRHHPVPAPVGKAQEGPCVFLGVTRTRELQNALEAVQPAGDATNAGPLRSRP